MGDDPMALLGLEGALKHYLLLLLSKYNMLQMQAAASHLHGGHVVLVLETDVPLLLLLLQCCRCC
jgi:hypothetical protein